MVSEAGPDVTEGPWSRWEDRTPSVPRQRTVDGTVTRLEAVGETEEFDNWLFGDGADWTIYIQVGDEITRHSTTSANEWRGSKSATHVTSATVVPVRITVVERDEGPDSSFDPDDPVHLSPETGREPAVVYVDTANGYVYGDVNGAYAGRTFRLRAPEGNDNRAEIDFRISVR